jgi:hypothetical protein
MVSRASVVCLAVVSLLLFLPGCNALNPLCRSARPAPQIGSLSPNTLTFAQVQQGVELTVNGSNFVSASEVLADGTALATTIVSSTQLKVTISTGVISGPGTVAVSVRTPAGNTGDLGCTSGGTSSTLTLTVT